MFSFLYFFVTNIVLLDSWLRTALLTNLKHKRKLNDVEKRESSVQTNGQAFEIFKSKSPARKLLYYGSYWKQAFQAPFPSGEQTLASNSRYTDPLYVETHYGNVDDDMRPSKSSSSYFSPVRSTNAGSKRYAYERMRTKDFHIPDYRTGGGHIGAAPSGSSSSAASKSVDYEIEAYFDYLKLFCEEENERLLSKGVQYNSDGSFMRASAFSTPKRQPWAKHYETSLRRQRRDDMTFDQTCASLQNALHEIDLLASGFNKERIHGADQRRAQREYEHSSISSKVSPRSLLKRSSSLPMPLNEPDIYLKDLNEKLPYKGILKHSVQQRYPLSLAVEHKLGVDWMPTVYFASSIPATTTALKRVHSLPQISERSDSFGTKHSKSMDSFSVSKSGHDKYASSDAEETDISLDSDVMEVSFDEDGRIRLINTWNRPENAQVPVSSGYGRLSSPWSDAVNMEQYHKPIVDYSHKSSRPFVSIDSYGRSISNPNIRHDLRIFHQTSPAHQSTIHRPTVYRPPSSSLLGEIYVHVNH